MMNRNGEYSGCVDCVTKLIRSEGFFALWKGFTPYFFRLGPHTILTFVFLEQLNKLFAKYYMKQNSFVSFKHFTHISIHLFVSLSELLVVSTIIFIQTILLDDTVSDVLSLSNAFLLPSLPRLPPLEKAQLRKIFEVEVRCFLQEQGFYPQIPLR